MAPNTDTDTDTDTPEPEKRTRGKRACATVGRPDEIEESMWRDFLRVRTAKKAPMTPNALAGMRREAAKAGRTLADVIAECVLRGWTTVKADWGPKGRNGHVISKVIEENRFAGQEPVSDL